MVRLDLPIFAPLEAVVLSGRRRGWLVAMTVAILATSTFLLLCLGTSTIVENQQQQQDGAQRQRHHEASRHPQCDMPHDIVCTGSHPAMCGGPCDVAKDGNGVATTQQRCVWSSDSTLVPFTSHFRNGETSNVNRVGYRYPLDTLVNSPWSDGLRCDRRHRNVSFVGGNRWFRFTGMANGLPTSPPGTGPSSKVLRCQAAGPAWVSAWPTAVEHNASPPIDYAEPGSLPGDGPQGHADAPYNRHTVCFDVSTRGASVEIYRFDRSRGNCLAAYERGVLSYVWNDMTPVVTLATMPTVLWFSSAVAFTQQIPALRDIVDNFMPYVDTFMPHSMPRVDNFMLRFACELNAHVLGDHAFQLTSDDGSRLYIGEQLVVDNDGEHSRRTRSGSIRLLPGWHKLVLTYFHSIGGAMLMVSLRQPGDKHFRLVSPDTIRPAAFTIQQTPRHPSSASETLEMRRKTQWPAYDVAQQDWRAGILWEGWRLPYRAPASSDAPPSIEYDLRHATDTDGVRFLLQNSRFPSSPDEQRVLLSHNKSMTHAMGNSGLFVAPNTGTSKYWNTDRDQVDVSGNRSEGGSTILRINQETLRTHFRSPMAGFYIFSILLPDAGGNAELWLGELDSQPIKTGLRIIARTATESGTLCSLACSKAFVEVCVGQPHVANTYESCRNEIETQWFNNDLEACTPGCADTPAMASLSKKRTKGHSTRLVIDPDLRPVSRAQRASSWPIWLNAGDRYPLAALHSRTNNASEANASAPKNQPVGSLAVQVTLLPLRVINEMRQQMQHPPNKTMTDLQIVQRVTELETMAMRRDKNFARVYKQWPCLRLAFSSIVGYNPDFNGPRKEETQAMQKELVPAASIDGLFFISSALFNLPLNVIVDTTSAGKRGRDNQHHDNHSKQAHVPRAPHTVRTGTCAYHTVASILNCGDFVLWRLPDVPSDCEIPLGYCGAAIKLHKR